MTIELTDAELDSICFALANVLALDATGAAALETDAALTIRSLYRRLLLLSKSDTRNRVKHGD